MRSSATETPEEADGHNFGGARRWLRHWQQGQVLRGRNDFQEFNVTAGEIKNLIVLSVVKVDDGHVWARRKRASWPDGALVEASVPESVLQLYAELAGSAADVAHFVAKAAKADAPMRESEALRVIAAEREKALRDGWAHPKLRPDRDQALDEQIGQTLIMALRHMPKEIVTQPTPASPMTAFAVFNDLDWEMSVHLIGRTADTIRLVRDVPQGAYGPNTLGIEVNVGPYLFVVLAADIRQAPNAVAQILPLIQQRKLERPSYPPMLLGYNLVGRPDGFLAPIMSGEASSGRTVTARFLQEIDYSD
jgi:hypothetical protein